MARLVLDETKKTSKIVKCIICILAVNGSEEEIQFGFSSARKCTMGARWQFLIDVKQCGGHSLRTGLNFGIECFGLEMLGCA